MNYYLNYDKLLHPKIGKYHYLIIIILLGVIVFVILSFKVKVSTKLETYGLYKDGILQIEINSKLSDKIKQSKMLVFNKKKVNYTIESFNEYEFINNELYQNIYLVVDNKFYDNEMGIVEFHYDNKKLISYIFDLFK